MTTTVGVIGAGYISRFHFKAYAETKTPVALVADVNRAAAEAAAAPFGAAVTEDWRKVIAHPTVNVVVVLTSSGSHFEMVRAALEAGKNVISEKTLTLSAKQSLELGKLAEASNLILYTSYMKRFFPAVQKTKELIPRLGHLMSVYARTYQVVAPDNFHSGTLPGWVSREADGASPIRKKSGGGVLVCGGSHILDLLLHLTGKPRGVFTRNFTREGSDVDLMSHALLDLEGGGTGHFEANWHPLRKIGYEKRGWDECLEISGVNGRLVIQIPVWNEPENNAATLTYYDNEAETFTDYALPIVNPFVEAQRSFLENIAQGRQGPQDRYTGYRVDLLLEKMQQSADAGRPVEIRWDA